MGKLLTLDGAVPKKQMREKWNCESYRAHTMERARE
jgi:hypothetical protein